MSIASELNALNGHILGAYDAIDTKGGTIPQNKNMANLPDAIDSIPSGGGGADNNWAEVMSGSTNALYDNDILSLRQYGLLGSTSQYLYLTSISFPNLVDVNGSSFSNQEKIQSFYLPKLTSINGGSNFQGCTACTEIKLPSLTTLPSTGSLYTFQNCTNLTKIDLGDNTNSISGQFGTNMFRYSGVSALILRWNNVATATGANFIYSTPIYSGTGYIYVPKSLVNTYKSTNYYNAYQSLIRAIEDYSDDGTVNGNITV